MRDAYLALIGAFLAGDTARVATLLDGLGFATASGEPATLQVFAELLLGEFRASLTTGGTKALDPQAMVAKAREVMEAARQDPVIRIPAEFVMLARVFLSLGGLFQHYRPEIDYSRPLLAVLAERSAASPSGPAGPGPAGPSGP